MLHTKFRGNRSDGSGKKIFEGFFTIYGHGGHLGLVTSIILIHFHFHVPTGHRELIICPIDSNGDSLVFDSLFCISEYM